jgi:phospholipid/cholesterol/gamma-HCH transport system substrate-binding protein
MTTLSAETRHAFIGAATVLVLALFFVWGYSGDPQKHEESGYRLWAEYRTAGGLEPGSPVLMAGLEIGAVRRLELNRETNQAVVEMTIDDGIEIPIDSEAAIMSDGFAGGKYIRVIPGGDFDVLMADETFEFVRGTVDFMELFEKIVIMAESRRDDSDN